MNSIFYFLIILLFSGCKNTTHSTSEKHTNLTTCFSGEAMTMHYKIIIGKKLDDHEIFKTNRVILDTFNTIDNVFNKWNPESEISRLNRHKAHIPFSLSPLLEQLFQQTDLIVELSEGLFDPTIEPLQKIWKEKLQFNMIPSQEDIGKISPALGWNKLHFKRGSVYKDHDLTQIDLGGIAKGFAVDILIHNLTDLGFADLYVEWGGEIRTIGEHPAKRPWTIYISCLSISDPSQAIDTISLLNQAIATSGDYFQNWTFSGHELMNLGKSSVTFFHIFNPKTLQPLEATHKSLASVSVLAPTCWLADGLATSAMLFCNIQDAKMWAESIQKKIPDITFWLVSRESESKISPD